MKPNLRMACMQLVTSKQPPPPFDCIHHNSAACCFSTVWLQVGCDKMKSNVLCPSSFILVRRPLLPPLVSFLSIFGFFFVFFLLLDVLQAKSTSTCCTRNPKPGARVRVSLSFGLQPTLTSLFCSSCTTLYFSVRRNTTGMLYAGDSAVVHTPNTNLRQCREEHEWNVLQLGNLLKSPWISNSCSVSIFNDTLIVCY